jgi:acetyltransferase
MRTPGEALLRQLTDIDPERDAALIALVGEGDAQRQVGVARYSRTGDGRAEVAVTVGDDWRNRGLATALMTRLITLARQRGIQVLYSVDATDNEPMRRLARYLGFECSASPDDATQRIYTLRLKPAA